MNRQWDKEEMVEGRGRSAKKRAAKEVEELAFRLVEMPETGLKKLPASQEVREEIELARSTKGGSSRKRQIKHLAGALRRREEEAEQLRSFLDGTDAVHLQEKRDFHSLEELRDRLCDPELFAAALQEATGAFPLLEREALSRLARSVHDHGDRRAFREIFRLMRKAKDESAPD
ncbi:MAG: hypothetical protein C0617_04030 [Desulfuromonas sp.]|uniref:ribosome biogenesis factor YjgA n=1 Tax=Desulfuromonas sp. TaxID=892 RepID=UPI000CA91553|nr:ribosome biogenesis factor YjgA [Desulfuromonas sp.]PLX85471.1 MAG: hypothetical protein C0617_04030 [Desulfuromonas sp.]